MVSRKTRKSPKNSGIVVVYAPERFPWYIISCIVLVGISLLLFFTRNPRGSSRNEPKHFRYPEFFVALLFPGFYILYYATTMDMEKPDRIVCL